MSDYQLPCDCGRSVIVTPSQAGQQVNCECGITLDVPNLRGMKALERATSEGSDKKEPKKKARAWSRSQGTVFAIGLFLTVFMLILAVVMYYFRITIVATVPEIFQPTVEAKLIDQMGADKTFDVWINLRDDRLNYGGTRPPWVQYKEAKDLASALLYAFLIAAGVGALLTLTSFFLPGERDFRPRRPVA